MSSRRQMLEFLSVGRLPSAYQEVEYLESTGTQYIDTNLIINETFEFDAKIDDQNYYDNINHGTFAGERKRIDGAWSDEFCLNTYSTAGWFGTIRFGSVSQNGLGLSNGIQEYHFHNYTFTTSKGVSFTFTGINPFTAEQSLYLLAEYRNDEGTIDVKAPFKGKMYWCKLYLNSILVRDFVPCYRKSDNVAGLYDLVNNVFYTNAGTGSFIVGGNV